MKVTYLTSIINQSELVAELVALDLLIKKCVKDLID